MPGPGDVPGTFDVNAQQYAQPEPLGVRSDAVSPVTPPLERTDTAETIPEELFDINSFAEVPEGAGGRKSRKHSKKSKKYSKKSKKHSKKSKTASKKHSKKSKKTLKRRK